MVSAAIEEAAVRGQKSAAEMPTSRTGVPDVGVSAAGRGLPLCLCPRSCLHVGVLLITATCTHGGRMRSGACKFYSKANE